MSDYDSIGKESVGVKIEESVYAGTGSPHGEAGPSSSSVALLEVDKGKDELVSINIEDLDQNWRTSINRKLSIEPSIIKASSTDISCSIHRVPQRFRQHNEKAYEPQIISIGPFHCKKREGQLRAMEQHKWKYLSAIINRQKRENCLEQYLLVVKQWEKRARKCYSEEIEIDSDSFVEMMVLDGCFLIELFCRVADVHEFKDDPILRFGWLKTAVTADLVMLENQIPFFILQHLFNQMNISGPGLAELALSFFGSNLNCPNIQVQHLLHLVHYSRLPRSTNENREPGALQKINNASTLKESGIKFKMGDGDGFLDIKFRDGVIEIPPLKVEETTNPLFLNLVAFEQCYRHCNSYFAGYTYFMDCLIDTAKDAQILSQNGIIDRWLDSNEDVANLFNKLGREVIVYDYDFYLLSVCNEINQYHRTHWNVWRATLRRNYLNNPWAIISVTAAGVLLLLTFIQTFFNVFPKFSYGR